MEQGITNSSTYISTKSGDVRTQWEDEEEQSVDVNFNTIIKMKLKYYNKTALAVLILSFLMSSCRSVESGNSENIIDPPVSVGDASVVVNLLGPEFVESDGNNPQASTGKQLRNPQAKETYYTLTSPSTLLAAEVSEDTSVPLNTSAGINPVALVEGASSG